MSHQVQKTAGGFLCALALCFSIFTGGAMAQTSVVSPQSAPQNYLTPGQIQQQPLATDRQGMGQNGISPVPSRNPQDPTRNIQDPIRNPLDPTRNPQDPTRNFQDPTRNPLDPTRNLQDPMRAQTPMKPVEPSQFQLFVYESTGRLLPVHGSALFDAPQAYVADSSSPTPENYVLGPGDEIRLQVWGPVELNVNLLLDRNGQVSLPKVGVVTLTGVLVRDLDKVLRGHLGKVFSNFQSSASMGRLRGIQVYVVGQARQPGTFQLSSLSTLVNALFASGGPNSNGSMRNIELKRGGQTLTTFDLYDFLARGDKTRDVALLSGDVIVIPPVGPRVAITGAFDHAAIYELKSAKSSIGDILALGGGVPALAKTQKALLERISRDSNPPRRVQEIPLDSLGLSQTMQDGDVLTLLNISPAFANAVTLQGTVAVPLRYGWFEGMRILDLIPDKDALITGDYYKRKNLLVQNNQIVQLEGSTVATRVNSLADQINWEYAVIERMDKSQLSNQLIPFNLGKAVRDKDPEQNLLLQPGDVVTIFSQNDLRLPQDRITRMVRVEGEVAAPGVYQTLPGETLPQLLRRIGGVTAQAYIFGTEFSRESVRTRQQANLDTLINRLETNSQAQTASLTANQGAAAGANPALILQQQQQAQAQLKTQVDRLKTIKSNGRLALELNPRSITLASLPNLPLEDGDRILVPSTPGFVSAFGSVNNENVFIFRQGKTVANILASAGLTEDADPSQIFVLRADGSIVSRRDNNALFGRSFESLAVMPGDTVVVPAQMDRESRYNALIRGLKDWTSILSNFGLGVLSLQQLSKM